ncbi:peptidyl-prolyl cis-trans isomerse D [Deferribacter desulfuricans SSM1]|uniref:Periplasmic chaperone PpiD n=1 Tax=Deferribacter desulfuricans (strain DSM 14783 / JCM 11476 / NBRC 101012 / SSM1) TaxID=639282 RepID=D3PD53_DEFDS|nr:SurA N-terminal domain-containing protein [Deferribacter desulfuricans]BAI80526.1 peptidyl-prolyl cis-trans isomerse D [Deferribacter desulfuricans SSM1]
MLRMFRNQKKILAFFLWLVIAAFIGTIFLVWGVGGNRGRQKNYAIKVNDFEISFNEYQQEYDKFSNTLKSLLGGEIPNTININKQVTDSIIEKYLLLDQANKLGVFVSDVEVFNEIKNIPSFQTNGQFDAKRYVEILRLNGLTPASFERSIKADLLVQKTKNLITQSVSVNENEIKNEYIYRNKTAKISYIKLNSEKFKKDVTYNDEELKAYFEKNKEDYRVPEKIKLKYIKIDPKDFNKEIKVSDEEIEKYYLQHTDEFIEKEKVAAKHILIRVKDWNNKKEVAEAKKKIENILQKIKKGAKFEDLAKKYSDDPTAKNGGDLGYFTKGQMIKEFEDVVFKLKPGDISDIVKTKFGYHIIKVYGHKPEKKLTLDEAKPLIIKKLKTLKKDSYFKEYVLDIYRDILKASNITAYTLEHKDIPVYETDYFSMFDNIPPIGNDLKLKTKLFKLETSEVTNIIDINGVKYIFELIEKKKSYIPKFEDVKKEVINDYINDKSVELAKDNALSLIKKYNELQKIADSKKLSITTTPDFKRIDPIPDIGTNEELSKKIFNKGKGLLETPFVVGNNIFIIEVNNIKYPDFSKITEDEKKEIESYILSIKQDEALNSYIEKLKNNAKIEVNPSIK